MGYMGVRMGCMRLAMGLHGVKIGYKWLGMVYTGLYVTHGR